MKLRIRGNSIRLRLLKSEVANLRGTGVVADSTEFPGGSKLTYRIAWEPEAASVSASFVNDVLSVHVPKAELLAWAEDEEKVGIEAEADGLSILIEKDFVCLTRTDDPDNLDAYPNPEIVCT